MWFTNRCGVLKNNTTSWCPWILTSILHQKAVLVLGGKSNQTDFKIKNY